MDRILIIVLILYLFILIDIIEYFLFPKYHGILLGFPIYSFTLKSTKFKDIEIQELIKTHRLIYKFTDPSTCVFREKFKSILKNRMMILPPILSGIVRRFDIPFRGSMKIKSDEILFKCHLGWPIILIFLFIVFCYLKWLDFTLTGLLFPVCIILIAVLGYLSTRKNFIRLSEELLGVLEGRIDE
jgi:hypothetical protein